MMSLRYLWNARPSVVDMVPTVQVGSHGYLTPVVGAKRATYLFVPYPVSTSGLSMSFPNSGGLTFGGSTNGQQSPNGGGSSGQMIGQSWPTLTGGGISTGTNLPKYSIGMCGSTSNGSACP